MQLCSWPGASHTGVTGAPPCSACSQPAGRHCTTHLAATAAFPRPLGSARLDSPAKKKTKAALVTWLATHLARAVGACTAAAAPTHPRRWCWYTHLPANLPPAPALCTSGSLRGNAALVRSNRRKGRHICLTFTASRNPGAASGCPGRPGRALRPRPPPAPGVAGVRQPAGRPTATLPGQRRPAQAGRPAWL